MKTETLPTPAITDNVAPTLDLRLTSRDAWQEAVVMDNMSDSGSQQFENVKPPRTLNDIDSVNTVDVAYTALNRLLADDRSHAGEELKAHVDDIRKRHSAGVPTVNANPFLEDWDSNLVDYRPQLLAGQYVQEYFKQRDLTGSHARLLEAWPVAQRVVKAGLDAGIAQGYVPHSVVGRIEDAFKKTTVRITDNKILEQYGYMSAYYHNALDEIGVVHGTNTEGMLYEDNLVHEVIHKLSGGTFWEGETDENDPQTKLYRQRVGFSTESGDRLSQTGLNEAVTEHMTAGVTHGDFETIDPDRRVDGDRGYYGYRKVLAVLVERSGGQLTAKMITQAYFEDTGTKGDIGHRMKFIRGIHTAFGPGALRKINELMEASNDSFSEQNMHGVLECIVPPEVDDSGAIVKRGRLESLPVLQSQPMFDFSSAGLPREWLEQKSGHADK